MGPKRERVACFPKPHWDPSVPFLIGTDEAGYGPNLGPLTVTGTLWEVSDSDVDLYRCLDETVTNKSSADNFANQRIFIADSKQVYASARSIVNLETGVLALLRCVSGRIPSTWLELIQLICPQESIECFPDQPWLLGQTLELPIASQVEQIEILAASFTECCAQANVRLRELRCVPVFPPQFNLQVERLGNKATLLSSETLKIVRALLDVADDDVEVGCDKHGGRSKYAALIQQFLTEQFVTVGNESLATSDYFFRENDRDVVIRFQAKGESFLPTALASMVSKYVREIFMSLWNEFWQLKIPDLKPTKGYPVDAKRFKNDIRQIQKTLGIEDHLIWRSK